MGKSRLARELGMYKPLVQIVLRQEHDGRHPPAMDMVSDFWMKEAVVYSEYDAARRAFAVVAGTIYAGEFSFSVLSVGS